LAVFLKKLCGYKKLKMEGKLQKTLQDVSSDKKNAENKLLPIIKGRYRQGKSAE